MTPPPTRRRGAMAWGMRIMLFTGFLLAVAATGLVVFFAEETRWLKIAVMLALWAALIAAFAVARVQRDSAAAKSREDDLARTYQVELQREVSARREFEIALSEQSRNEVDQIRQEAHAQLVRELDEVRDSYTEQLAGVRTELEKLTTALAGLMDGDVLIHRMTLSAEATRVSGGRLGPVRRPELATVVSEDDGARWEAEAIDIASAQADMTMTDTASGSSVVDTVADEPARAPMAPSLREPSPLPGLVLGAEPAGAADRDFVVAPVAAEPVAASAATPAVKVRASAEPVVAAAAPLAKPVPAAPEVSAPSTVTPTKAAGPDEPVATVEPVAMPAAPAAKPAFAAGPTAVVGMAPEASTEQVRQASARRAPAPTPVGQTASEPSHQLPDEPRWWQTSTGNTAAAHRVSAASGEPVTAQFPAAAEHLGRHAKATSAPMAPEGRFGQTSEAPAAPAVPTGSVTPAAAAVPKPARTASPASSRTPVTPAASAVPAASAAALAPSPTPTTATSSAPVAEAESDESPDTPEGVSVASLLAAFGSPTGAGRRRRRRYADTDDDE